MSDRPGDSNAGRRLLYGCTVRSPVPRGRLERIDFDPALPWDDIVVVTAADVPGTNRVKLIDLEQPFLVEREIRHREEPVVLLAHEDRDLLARAVRAVRLVVTPEEPVLSLERSTTEFLAHTLEKGHIVAGFAEAEVVVEGIYETGAHEHVYIEPQGMLAEPRPGGGVIIRGSLQCPYYVQPAVALLLGVSAEQVQVIQTTTGGGFGGKEAKGSTRSTCRRPRRSSPASPNSAGDGASAIIRHIAEERLVRDNSRPHPVKT